jgi:hypothetical protein
LSTRDCRMLPPAHVQMVRRFVKIAKHCRRLNNFNAVCACAARRIAAARAL